MRGRQRDCELRRHDDAAKEAPIHWYPWRARDRRRRCNDVSALALFWALVRDSDRNI